MKGNGLLIVISGYALSELDIHHLCDPRENRDHNSYNYKTVCSGLQSRLKDIHR